MNKQPLLIMLVCFVTGIIIQDYFLLKHWLCGVLFVGAVGIVLASLIFKNLLVIKMRAWFSGLVFLLLGILLHSFNSRPPKILAFPENPLLIFALDKKLNSSDENRRYVVTIYHNKQTLKSTLAIPKAHKELDFRHYYRAKLMIKRTEKPEHDYQFNYARYLERRDIYYRAYLPEGFQVAEKPPLGIKDYLRQKRWVLLQKIRKSALSSSTQNFLTSIILADRTEMTKDTVTNFRKSGLIHILTISGTHIGVIFGAVFIFFRRIFPIGFQKAVIPLNLTFIWLFAIFIGGANPVIRACTMLTTYFIFIILQRKPDVLHALALAGFVLLLVDTHKVFDVGFQLSFSAVLGIFWLNSPILKLLPPPRNWLQKILWYTFSVTMAAQLGIMPFILYHFHQYTLISIFANILIVPFAQLIIIFSLVIVILKAVKFQFVLIEQLYDHVVYGLLKLIEFFARWDKLYFERIPFSIPEFIAFYVMVFLLRFLLLKPNLKNIMRSVVSIMMFLVIKMTIDFHHQQRDEVVLHELFNSKLLSVKKGEVVYFYIRRSVDANRLEEFVISPYLTSVRCKKHYIIIVPSDIDHISIDKNKFFLQ